MKELEQILRDIKQYQASVRTFVADLDEQLSQFGYTVVPIGESTQNGWKTTATPIVLAVDPKKPNLIRSVRKKTLPCPRCDRKFAHPMNLARHQASHKGKR